MLRDAARSGAPLTVVSLAREEPTGRPCCDTRSVYWNGVQRELAETELAARGSPRTRTPRSRCLRSTWSTRRARDTGVCHMALFVDPDGNDLMLHRRYAPPS